MMIKRVEQNSVSSVTILFPPLYMLFHSSAMNGTLPAEGNGEGHTHVTSMTIGRVGSGMLATSWTCEYGSMGATGGAEAGRSDAWGGTLTLGTESRAEPSIFSHAPLRLLSHACLSKSKLAYLVGPGSGRLAEKGQGWVPWQRGTVKREGVAALYGGVSHNTFSTLLI